jgi:hypothetical protein
MAVGVKNSHRGAENAEKNIVSFKNLCVSVSLCLCGKCFAFNVRKYHSSLTVNAPAVYYSAILRSSDQF